MKHLLTLALTLILALPALAEDVQEFKGKIAKKYEDSVEWWPKSPRPPEGAPNVLILLLDRIQVVKGWLGADGKAQEKVYDVVWSDERKKDADGKVPAVGNTVIANAETVTWTNTIGEPELITVWTDPDFDPKQSAFYYARVIEIPTPRWTAYDTLRFGIKMDPKVPMTTQERAYTSPIWYTPWSAAFQPFANPLRFLPQIENGRDDDPGRVGKIEYSKWTPRNDQPPQVPFKNGTYFRLFAE